MISAPSPRLLLNGSKLILITALLFFTSCFTQRDTSGTQPSTPEKKPPVQKPKEESGKTEEKDIEKRDEYTIALLLPFQSKKVYITDLLTADYYFPEESQLAVEYYKGAMIALDSLKEAGLKARLLVYDSGEDTTQLAKVLARSSLKESHLIIGPVSNSSLKMVSNYALKNKIYLVSPFSATAVYRSPNPYYILANATMKSHCEKIYDYIKKIHAGKDVYMIYRKKEDAELAGYFINQKKVASQPGETVLNLKEITDSTDKKYSRLKDQLSRDKKNIIVIPSNDESFVRMILKQLENLSDDYEVEVYGMPTWSNFEGISDDQLEKMHIHITQPFWLDKYSTRTILFKEKYLKQYNVNPTPYSIRGYDQMMYFGKLLFKDGKNLDAGFKKNTQQALAEKFKIAPVPVSETDHTTWFYENKSVYMMQFELGKLVRIAE